VASDDLFAVGLRAPVRLSIDRWGVTHIRAEHDDDLFFAQGFNAARDRLWQIDLWRKRGLGRLAADFGPGYLAQDRAARLFLYRGDMDAEWAAYGPEARAVCEAFVAGINAYVDLAVERADRLPPEFQTLGTRPARWQAEDVVRIRTHGWMRNALSELVRANVMARADAKTDRLRIALEPPIEPHATPGLDLASLPIGALDVYRLAISPVTFNDERLGATLAQAWEWTHLTPAGDIVRLARPAESNNWAVHGSRTAAGRPVLASDPHRLHAVPSLRYLVHLTSPGLDLIGAGEPNFPGIVIGHNGHSAFGLTLFLGPDQEDVYVYDTALGGTDVYRYGDSWEPMRLIEETFDVKGAPPQRLTLKFTRHGPVVHDQPSERRAIAVRSVWSHPGAAPYGASLVAMRAKSVEEFRAALRRWGAPAVNQVYADRDGHIAWLTAGFSPVRRHWDGLLPVPGDGRYEWEGFLDPDVMPSACDPAAGYVSSANAMNLPAGWSHDEHPMGREWDDPSRARRIEELLSADRAHSVGASCAMQTDVVSLPARRLCALVDRLRVQPPGDAADAISLLRSWDHRVSAESRAAALHEIWWTRHLRPALLARLVPDARVRDLLVPADVESVLAALEQGAPADGLTHADRDTLLVESLSAAYRACVQAMGPDARQWSWGRLHTSRFEPALPLAGVSPDIPPLPLGGGESTLAKAVYRPDGRVVMGASVRIVVDVGDWDKSVWINAPGQSGDPRSPHYADLVAPWAKGEYVPMLYSELAVREATEAVIIVRPA
jgi:penicillin amidase